MCEIKNSKAIKKKATKTSFENLPQEKNKKMKERNEKYQIIEKKGREMGQKRLKLALFLQQEEEQDFSVSVFTFFSFFSSL